jgi:hypothetical protein
MERHRSSQIAKRPNNRDTGSDDTAMEFEQFVFFVEVKADMKPSRVFQQFVWRQGTESERRAILIQQDSQAVFSRVDAPHFEVTFEERSKRDMATIGALQRLGNGDGQ